MTYTADVATNFGTSSIYGGAGGSGTSLLPTDTALLLPSGNGAKFPALSGGSTFRIQIGTTDIAKVTAINTDTLTIVRRNALPTTDPDYNASAPPTWPVGTSVQLAITAGSLADLWNAINSGRIFNVKDYGAVGDGITDDTTAIANALNAASAATIASPVSAPTVIQQAGGSFANGAVVNVAYTWLHYLGETLPSPTQQITITTLNNQIKVTVPSFPANVFGANVYISAVSSGVALYKGEAGATSGILPSITASGGNKTYNNFAATTDAITNPAAPTRNDTGRGSVYFPAGTYITGPQSLYSHVSLIGEGMGISVLRLKANSNADLLSAYVSSISASTPLAHGSPQAVADFTIRDLTLDGNMYNQTAGPSYPLDMYAFGYTLLDLEVMNGFSGGVRADYSGPMPWSWNGQGGSPTSINSRKVEADWHNVHVHTTLNNAAWSFASYGPNPGIGIQFLGPHDSRWTDVISFAHLSHSVYLGPNSDGLQYTNCHSYSPGAATDTTAVSLLNEGIALYAVSSEAEGSVNEQMVLLAGRCNWTGGSIYGSTSTATASGLQIGQAAGLLPLNGSTFKALQSAPAAPTATGNTGSGSSFTINQTVNVELTWVQVVGGFIVGETVASAATLVTIAATGDNLVVTVPAVPAWATGANVYISAVSGGGTVYKAASNVGAGTQTFTNFTSNTNPQPPATGTAYATTAVAVSDYQFLTRFEDCRGANGCINFANDGGFGLLFAGMLAATGGDKIYVGTPAGSTYLMVTADGFTTDTRQQIQLNKGIQAWGQSATAVAIATSGTIATATDGISRVAPTGAVTGVIMAAGSFAGQVCIVINEAVAANSVTMAASGTSHVADGVSCVIAGLTQKTFIWDTGTSLWYHS